MKYVWTIIIIGAVAGLVWWLRETPPIPEDPSSKESTVSSSPLPGSSIKEEAPEKKEENKTVIKKTTINNMTIEILKEGTGEAIKNGQTAVVDYTGTLTDGTVFDSSIPRGQPFSFPLGAGMVIQGWEEGVLGMKVGETRKLTIPPELAYGSRGAGAVIPPNATLIFEVTLQAIK